MMVRNDNWDPDSGLGKDSEGKLYPVKTVLKRDRKGLGEGKALNPKVTNFAPFDLAIEESTKKQNQPPIRHARIIRKWDSGKGVDINTKLRWILGMSWGEKVILISEYFFKDNKKFLT